MLLLVPRVYKNKHVEENYFRSIGLSALEQDKTYNTMTVCTDTYKIIHNLIQEDINTTLLIHQSMPCICNKIIC